MKNNRSRFLWRLKRFLLKCLLPIAFWIGLWQLCAVCIGNKFLFASVPDTLSALKDLFISASFLLSVGLSLLRVVAGLSLGICFGIIIAILCHSSSLLSAIILPFITIIKSTPVASFIVVLWVMMSGDALAIFIAILMVMPIICQNLLDGYASIDVHLSEVAKIFGFSRLKTFRVLIFPTLKSYLIPAIITASGLAWKAEIAAEIIAYTKRSIGQGINDAKYDMDTARVFAWTVVVVTLSIILEKCTKYLLRRFAK